jgi:hypothetical protein
MTSKAPIAVWAWGDVRVGDPRSFYSGWLVDPDDRARLLEQFAPRYSQVVAHHVTLKFGDRPSRLPRPRARSSARRTTAPACRRWW